MEDIYIQSFTKEDYERGFKDMGEIYEERYREEMNRIMIYCGLSAVCAFSLLVWGFYSF